MENLVAIIGAGQCDELTYQLAQETGRLTALAGYGVLTGGLGGVMEAACKGAKEVNGLTVGIIPQDIHQHANPHVDIVIPTGMGIMRNLLVVRAASAIIAIDGKYGTLSEIAFALQLNKKVIGIDTWQVSENIIVVKSPKEAVQKLNPGL